MGCYCSSHAPLWSPVLVTEFDYSTIKNKQGKYVKEKSMICLEKNGLWLLKKFVNFLNSTTAVFMNGAFSSVFLALGVFTKKHTKNEEMITAFSSIFLMEFMNIGMISLITSLTYFQDITIPLLAWTD